MASSKEILDRIKSIEETKKITKAMYMMSSMKVRKAKQKLQNTEPYFNELQNEISNILYHFPEMESIFFDNRPSDKKEAFKKKAYIVLTGDKGMCGAYNHNVIKKAEEIIKGEEHYKLFIVGELGRRYFKNKKKNIDESFRFTATKPSIHRARVIAELIIEAYREEEFDEVYIIYTKMKKSVVEEVMCQRILPLMTKAFLKDHKVDKNMEGVVFDEDDSEFLIEPSLKVVLEKVLYNYFIGFMYCALVEACACEENARMTSMQNATDNAEKILHNLSIEYNRARQAAITQEITEVIGGAKALKKKKKK